MRPRILILHQNMGSGHKRVARIVEDMLRESMEADIVNIPANELLGSRCVKGFERWWNATMQRDWVRFADFVGAFLFRATVVPVLDAISVSAIHNRLDELRPDVIISTADGFNKILGAYADEKGIPFFLFTTSTSAFVDNVYPSARHLYCYDEAGNALRDFDLSTTYFSHPLTRRTGFFQRMRYVLGVYRDCCAKGLGSLYRDVRQQCSNTNRIRCCAVGPLVERRHFQAKNTEQLKRNFGIADGRLNVVLACGGLGGRLLLRLVNAILEWRGTPLNLLVLCGRDVDTLDRLRRRNPSSANIDVWPFGYVDNVDEFLAAADCVIARPSAGVFNESLVNRIPIVVVERVTSNDHGALMLIREHGLGEVCPSTQAVIPALETVLAHKERYHRNIAAFLSAYPQTYEAQRDIIVGEVRKALGERIPDSRHETASR